MCKPVPAGTAITSFAITHSRPSECQARDRSRGRSEAWIAAIVRRSGTCSRTASTRHVTNVSACCCVRFCCSSARRRASAVCSERATSSTSNSANFFPARCSTYRTLSSVNGLPRSCWAAAAALPWSWRASNSLVHCVEIEVRRVFRSPCAPPLVPKRRGLCSAQATEKN